MENDVHECVYVRANESKSVGTTKRREKPFNETRTLSFGPRTSQIHA